MSLRYNNWYRFQLQSLNSKKKVRRRQKCSQKYSSCETVNEKTSFSVRFQFFAAFIMWKKLNKIKLMQVKGSKFVPEHCSASSYLLNALLETFSTWKGKDHIHFQVSTVFGVNVVLKFTFGLDFRSVIDHTINVRFDVILLTYC